MYKNRFSFESKYLLTSLFALLAVLVTTVPLFLIGRDVLGEGVITLVYLVPVTWSANRWGRLPGLVAALTAALTFDFLFTSPFYTFVVDHLEDWLILAIFLLVAVWVVDRIQANITRAREAVLMYDMSVILCNQRTPEAVAYAVAREIQSLFQAALVNVIFRPEAHSPAITATEPAHGMGKDKPDRLVPILTSWGLVGEIQIWSGLFLDLPTEDSRLLSDFASQAARAFERTYHSNSETSQNGLTFKPSLQK